MPKWMRWIESVKTQKDDPDLTDWILAAQGFRFTWKARITQRVEEHSNCTGHQWVVCPPRVPCAFIPKRTNCTVVKLSVSYELPRVLAPLMDPSILGGIVTKELQANLDRFRDLVEVVD